jgi:tetratricopeptide (TPR) repeat protein
LVACSILIIHLLSRPQAVNQNDTSTGNKGEAKEAAQTQQPQLAIPPARSTKDAEDCTRRGETFRHNGELEKAIEQYTLALKYDPEYYWAFLNRASTYDDERMRRPDQLKRAVDDCNQALKLIPSESKDLATAYARRGNAYRHLKAFDEAIADYTKSLQFVKDDPKVYYYRGLCYEGKGDSKHAKADKDMGIRLGYKPNSSK